LLAFWIVWSAYIAIGLLSLHLQLSQRLRMTIAVIYLWNLLVLSTTASNY
jgi:hypothetical protein